MIVQSIKKAAIIVGLLLAASCADSCTDPQDPALHWPEEQLPLVVVLDTGGANIQPYVVKAIDKWNDVCPNWEPFMWGAFYSLDPTSDTKTFSVEIYLVDTLVNTSESDVRAKTYYFYRKNGELVSTKIKILKGLNSQVIQATVFHELGHVLGLTHNEHDKNSIMQAKVLITPDVPIMLTPQDKNSINKRYDISCPATPQRIM